MSAKNKHKQLQSWYFILIFTRQIKYVFKMLCFIIAISNSLSLRSCIKKTVIIFDSNLSVWHENFHHEHQLQRQIHSQPTSQPVSLESDLFSSFRKMSIHTAECSENICIWIWMFLYFLVIKMWMNSCNTN